MAYCNRAAWCIQLTCCTPTLSRETDSCFPNASNKIETPNVTGAVCSSFGKWIHVVEWSAGFRLAHWLSLGPLAQGEWRIKRTTENIRGQHCSCKRQASERSSTSVILPDSSTTFNGTTLIRCKKKRPPTAMSLPTRRTLEELNIKYKSYKGNVTKRKKWCCWHSETNFWRFLEKWTHTLYEKLEGEHLRVTSDDSATKNITKN